MKGTKQTLLGLFRLSSLWWAIVSASATGMGLDGFPEDARVKVLYEAECVWHQQEFGNRDDEFQAGFLPHVDAASQLSRLQYWRRALAELDSIPVQKLKLERVNAAVFRAVLRTFIAQQEFRDYEAPITSGISFWIMLSPRGAFTNTEEYQNYLGRMADIPRFFAEMSFFA